MGFGAEHHPLPWDVLRFDEERGGYVLDVDRRRLKDAPRHAADADAAFSNPGYTREVTEYWLVLA